MARAPVCAVILLLSMWGLYHGGGALLPPRIVYYTRPAPNVALNGISNQSSTNFYFGNAQNAIDGSLAANYLRSQCSYTEKESEPWWMVDLKAPHRVISVAITNRVLECCRERLFGAEIRIGNNSSNGGKLNPRCGVISSIESGETLLFSCKGMIGQYVTVTIPGREEHLVICEVQVFGFPVDGSEDVAVPKDLKTPNGAPNVAPKGIAQQSSLYNMYGEPKNAIDGSLDSNYLYMQCAGTNEQKDPWWMVDLKSKYKIFTVAITNRGDCCAERINGGEIRIGNSGENGGTKNPICGVITSMGYGQTLAFECDGMVGQYVTVHIPGAEHTLTICEVQVFGLPSDDADVQGPTGGDSDFELPFWNMTIPHIWDLFFDSSEEIDTPELPEPEGDNLAFRGITSQSSTYDKFGASENAIDGSPSTIYMSGHCSHTDLDVEPWWRVDLMSTFNVTKVKITNRVDCCPERINEAEIRIGNFPENGGTRNPRCAKIESLGRGKEGEYVCGMVGRYVTITIPNKAAYLTLCEVKVYGTTVAEGYTAAPWTPDFGDTENHDLAIELKNLLKHSNAAPNIATDATTSQSSTDGGESSNAIDGNLKKCTKTMVEKTPWWTIDLKMHHKIFFIAVTSQNDSSAQDLKEAEIHVGSSATGWKKNPICGILSSVGPGETFSFNCDGLEGRFVTIVIPDKDVSLSLCEVQVFALSVDTPSGDWNGDLEVQKKHHGVKNLAPQGIPAQSSYFSSRSQVTKPIDGSLASNYIAGDCTHTQKQLGPWWNVDLGSHFRISSVAITNRGDCCRERINGAQIRIGDSAENGGVENPKCGIVSRMHYGETLSFNCKGMEGRYVTIVIPGQRQYLSLCEVQVFGEPSELLPVHTQVVADVPSETNLVGRHFLFPEESITDYVVLTPAQPMRLNAFTLCMNLALNISENRETILFTYRTLYYDALTLWLESNGDVGFYMSGEGIMFPKLDKSKEWNQLCLTWESKHGRCELWVNGRRSGNKNYRKKSRVQPGGTVILGQDYDSYDGDFDKKQSYIGKIKDLNMWNKVLSLRSLQSVFNGKIKQRGDIFDWSDLSYSIKGNVKLV